MMPLHGMRHRQLTPSMATSLVVALSDKDGWHGGSSMRASVVEYVSDGSPHQAASTPHGGVCRNYCSMRAIYPGTSVACAMWVRYVWEWGSGHVGAVYVWEWAVHEGDVNFFEKKVWG
jgi:hypothetical protein